MLRPFGSCIRVLPVTADLGASLPPGGCFSLCFQGLQFDIPQNLILPGEAAITKGKGLGQRTRSPLISNIGILIIICELLLEARGWHFVTRARTGSGRRWLPPPGFPMRGCGRGQELHSGDGTGSGAIRAAALGRGKAPLSFKAQPELLRVSPALSQPLRSRCVLGSWSSPCADASPDAFPSHRDHPACSRFQLAGGPYPTPNNPVLDAGFGQHISSGDSERRWGGFAAGTGEGAAGRGKGVTGLKGQDSPGSRCQMHEPAL